MALFDFLKPNKLAEKLNKAIFQYWVNSGVANTMNDDPDDYIEKGYGSWSVYSIITRIDEMRKQAPLVLKRKNKDGTTEVVTGHELNRFQNKVNQGLTANDYITQYLTYLLTIGEMFTYHPTLTAGINKGKPTELFPMPANNVEIIEGTWQEPVKGYTIEGDETSEPFEKSEVNHSFLFNPDWNKDRSLHGKSPLAPASVKVATQNENDLTQLKQFENQGAPYIMYRDTGSGVQDRWTDTQRDQIEKKIKNAGSTTKRGLPLIMKDKVGIINLGSNLADLKVIESSEAGMTALCAVYKLPVELFGLGDKTYNNMKEARKSAWTDCIQPNLSRVAEAFNDMTINNYEPYLNEGLFWCFDYSEIEELQEEMKSKLEWMTLAKWTSNEKRIATGKEPIANPLMDEPTFAVNEAFLSDMGIEEDKCEKNFDDYMNLK